MCGLVGIAGKLMIKDTENFKQLLYISLSRGKDSTGVATITTPTDTVKERIEIEKEAIPSYRFIEIENAKKWSTVFDRFNHDLMMGHVRWATVGKVNRDNAHPFEKETLIGMHNGTLLNPEFRGKNETDSELMFDKMDAEGIYDTLEGLSPKSAYAVVVYEKDSQKIWIARNTHRSLYVGIHQSRDVLYWASEERFLDFIDEDLEIYYFAPYTLYEIDVNEIKAKNLAPWKTYKLTDKSKMDDPFETKVDLSKFNYGDMYGAYCDWYDDDEYKAYRNATHGTTVRRAKHDHTNTSVFNQKGKPVDDWNRFLDAVDGIEKEDTRPPFDIECVGCDNVIHPQDIEKSKVWYEGSMLCLCDSCRGVAKEMGAEEVEDDNHEVVTN